MVNQSKNIAAGPSKPFNWSLPAKEQVQLVPHFGNKSPWQTQLESGLIKGHGGSNHENKKNTKGDLIDLELSLGEAE